MPDGRCVAAQETLRLLPYFSLVRCLRAERKGFMANEDREERAAADQELPPDPAMERAVVRKAAMKLLPFLFLLYVVAYLDRVNVGFAKLQMNTLPWFNEAVYGTGAGIFFIGYFLFEVPSNLILQKVGARRWIARIMFTWGLIAMAMAFARDHVSFYALRFALGLAEAGFFPGMLLYMTYWFTARERARAVSLFMTANAVAFIFGGPISGLLMKMPSILGLAGWQQMFILEGLPAVLLGAVVLTYLPDGPEQARWLRAEEKALLAMRMRRAGEDRQTVSSHDKHNSAVLALVAPHAAIFCLIYFLLVVGMYGISLWLPQIVQSLGNKDTLTVGLLTAVPYILAGIVMVVNGFHSDRTGERRFHVAVPAAVGAFGLVCCAFLPPAASLASLAVAAAGMWATLGPFWSLPPQALSPLMRGPNGNPAALAAGIALINSVGNLGGFLGPFLVGKVREATPDFKASLLLLAGSVLAGGLLTLLVRTAPIAPEQTQTPERRAAGGGITAALLLLLLLPLQGAMAQAPAAQGNNYTLGADSQQQPDVPRGEVTRHSWKNSRIYPGTERDYWIYVPKQYDATRPACVMVFQDGGGFQNREGQYRVPVVFDNLIHRGEMPVTIGVFVNPGVMPPASPEKQLPRYGRSYEYDAVDDRYARFLLEELLPEVEKQYKLTQDPAGRALCGSSSGGIAAFTAAWERPDAFGKVISYIGSFTDLRGGHRYGTLIRKMEPRPLRIFLQDGRNDQDIYSGSWFIGNNDVAAALKFAGYDHAYVVGEGGHDGRQGGAILPDALRWLWRDYPGVTASTQPSPLTLASGGGPSPSRQPLYGILLPDEGWQEVAGLPTGAAVTALAAEPGGSVFVATAGRIVRVGPDGKVTPFCEDAAGVQALAFGPDGRLYAGQPEKQQVVAYGADGKATTLARRVAAVALTVDRAGSVYVVDGRDGRVHLIRGGKTTALSGAAAAGTSALLLTPDQGLLLLAPQPNIGKFVTSSRVLADGSLADFQPYFDLYLPYGQPGAGARGMAVDTQGWLYVATDAGIQICDQAGRVNAIIAPPPGYKSSPVSGGAGPVVFGGSEREYLYAIHGGKVYRRRTKARGVLSCEEPVRPRGPRL